MTHVFKLKTVFALSLGCALALGSQTAMAQDCDTESVAGAYGMNFDGFLAEERPNGKTKIFLNKRERGVGRLELNSDGTAAISIRGFAAGIPGSRVEGPFDVQFGGTWSVGADCTGEIDLDEYDSEVDWLFVAVADGSELFVLSGASLGQIQAKRISSE
jgi:hypothetical protein